MQIPLVDLKAQHLEIAEEVERGFASVLEQTAYILGGPVGDFERAFAEFSGVEHCIGVANGTDALEMVVRGLGIGPGDEVIVPANTFIASALAVTRAGATPVFVDSDADYDLIDVRQVKGKLGQSTRAVMAVDLFGQVAPFEALKDALAGTDVFLIEDAAQSQGASRGGVTAGGFGAGAGTSFYPGKNLGAYGDAGAVLTNDTVLAERVRKLGNYGGTAKYHHPEIGFNSRMDTLQAVVLNAKLRRLAGWNEQRRQAAVLYSELLAEEPRIVLPKVMPGNEPVWHLYVIRVPERDRVLAALHEEGVGAGVHYPIPCHLQGAYEELGHRKGDFPVSEATADRILSLPIVPGISEVQQRRVVEVLVKALHEQT
jgi:dTDP-4-amino-4,6-dideoxygalactose transaminase